MTKLERKMFLAMQNSKWWPVGDEAIEDMTKIAMKVVEEYTDQIHETLLDGTDAKRKIKSICYLHTDLMMEDDLGEW